MGIWSPLQEWYWTSSTTPRLWVTPRVRSGPWTWTSRQTKTKMSPKCWISLSCCLAAPSAMERSAPTAIQELSSRWTTLPSFLLHTFFISIIGKIHTSPCTSLHMYTHIYNIHLACFRNQLHLLWTIDIVSSIKHRPPLLLKQWNCKSLVALSLPNSTICVCVCVCHDNHFIKLKIQNSNGKGIGLMQRQGWLLTQLTPLRRRRKWAPGAPPPCLNTCNGSMVTPSLVG
jgi:hypothetical protein